MKSIIRIQKNRGISLLIVLLVFLYLFAPYTINNSPLGQIMFSVLFAVICLLYGSIEKKSIEFSFIAFFLIFISSFLTIVFDNELIEKVNLGVTLIIITTIFASMFKLKMKTCFNYDFLLFLLDIIIFVWGLFYILHITSMTDLFYKVYSNGNDEFFYRSIYLGKPVMSLRFHGRASYAYCGLFLINYFGFKKESRHSFYKKAYFFSMMFIIVFLLFLQSNAGFLAAFAFLIVLLRQIFIEKMVDRLLGVLLMAVVLFMLIAFNHAVFREYLEHLFTGDSNGLLGRYVNNRYLENNYYILRGGIGIFTLPEVFLSDSGLLVTLTRGGFFFLAAYYFCIVRFLQNNFEKKYFVPILAFIFLYELAYTNLIGVFNGLTWIFLFKYFTDQYKTSAQIVRRKASRYFKGELL